MHILNIWGKMYTITGKWIFGTHRCGHLYDVWTGTLHFSSVSTLTLALIAAMGRCLLLLCPSVCHTVMSEWHQRMTSQSEWHHRMATKPVAMSTVVMSTKCEWCHSQVWPRCRTPLYAHIWRSLMSSILSPYLGMPIYGHIVVIHPYDLIKHWRSTHKDDYARARLCSVTLSKMHGYVSRWSLYWHLAQPSACHQNCGRKTSLFRRTWKNIYTIVWGNHTN